MYQHVIRTSLIVALLLSAGHGVSNLLPGHARGDSSDSPSDGAPILQLAEECGLEKGDTPAQSVDQSSDFIAPPRVECLEEGEPGRAHFIAERSHATRAPPASLA